MTKLRRGEHRHSYAPHPNPDWATHAACTGCGFAVPTRELFARIRGCSIPKPTLDQLSPELRALFYTEQEAALTRPLDIYRGYALRRDGTRIIAVKYGADARGNTVTLHRLTGDFDNTIEAKNAVDRALKGQ